MTAALASGDEVRAELARQFSLAPLALPGRAKRDPLRRFTDKIKPLPSGCMEWSGSRSPQGYGWFSWGGKAVLAHRWGYEASRGPIPHGLVIDHLCRNRRCVNPAHLECVAMKENTRRGILHETIRAKAKQKTHCKRGHPLFGSNLRINLLGNRTCIVCQRFMADAWKANNRARVNERRRVRRAGNSA